MAKGKNNSGNTDTKEEKAKKNKATSGGGKDKNLGGLEGKMKEGKGTTSGSRGSSGT